MVGHCIDTFLYSLLLFPSVISNYLLSLWYNWLWGYNYIGFGILSIPVSPSYCPHKLPCIHIPISLSLTTHAHSLACNTSLNHHNNYIGPGICSMPVSPSYCPHKLQAHNVGMQSITQSSHWSDNAWWWSWYYFSIAEIWIEYDKMSMAFHFQTLGK